MHRSIKILDITSTATGEPFSIEGALKVTLWTSTTIGADLGTCVLYVETSSDGINWAVYNRLISNSSNTNSQTIERVTRVAFSSTSTNHTSLSPEDTFRWIRVKGGGSHMIVYAEVED